MAFNSNGPVVFDDVSNVTATPATELGTRMWKGGREYVYVYNDAATTISTGLACTALCSGTTSPYSVTVSTATSADLVIGICRNTDITAGTYGWVVTKGVTNITMIASSGTVLTKGMAEIGANGKFAPVSNTTGNAAAIAKAVATIVSSAAGDAFVFCCG